MYAIVDMQGQQMQVSAGDEVYVNRLPGETGSSVTFDQVLLVVDGEDTRIGKPNLEGCSVQATILGHMKDDKVLVFKKKRRKGYQVKNGHRQFLSRVKVETINV
jgi:large subunit ribosomal protein L21